MQFLKLKTKKANISYSRFEGAQSSLFHLMIVPENINALELQMEAIKEAFETTLSKIKCRSHHIVFQRYFVSDLTNQNIILQSQNLINEKSSISIVQQSPLTGSKVCVWAIVIKGKDDSRFNILKEPNKLIADHNGYAHVFSTRLHSKETAVDSYMQTKSIFKDYLSLLKGEDLKLEDHCIRTWFYVRDIDNNYAGLVQARNEVFEECNLTKDTHYIASTGIEGRFEIPSVSVLMDAYSIKGLCTEQVKFLEAKDYLNPTHEYGVAFERGTSVDYGDQRQVFISGTASINERGEVVHENNILGQIKRTFENIKALLNEVEVEINDIASMVVYLRDVSDYKTVETYIFCNYPLLPYLIVWAPVCRPGWLIEIECIAIKEINEPKYSSF